MQATPRGRSSYAFAFADQVFPPPPKPTSWKGVPSVEGANRASTITSATTKVRPIEISTIEADPRWLEEEVVRLIKKHGLEALPEVRKIAIEQLRAAQSQDADVDVDFVVPPPSRLLRIGRTLRTSFLVALLVVSAGLVARWRYPVQSEALVTKAHSAIARVTPPSSWSHAVMRVLDPRASRAMVAPEAAPALEAAPPPVAAAPADPLPSPIVAAPETPPTALATEAPPPAAPEPAASPAPEALASVSVSDLPAAVEPKHAAPAVHHAALAPAVMAPVAPKPAPAPVVTAAPAPKEPPPAPGSLAEAIQRAGTRGAGKVPTIGEHAITADPKVVAAASLPERPSASVVTSALLAVLPDARACLNDGDDPRQASVVFDASGAVNAVQVSGAGASCVQKALSHAHVAAFSQPTYRATITVRPN